jgi:tetratricopeptide (TPR) repeat protein
MDDPDAQQLLAILSKLPSGTTRQNLKLWASSVNRLLAATATLNDIALVTQDKATSTLFVLPVVQSYLREDSFYNSPRFQGLVLDACCKFIMSHKSSPGHPSFKADVDALSAEQVNIQAILLTVTAESFVSLKVPSSTVFEAMLAFAWFQFWKKRSDVLLTHMLEIGAKMATEGDEDTARYIAAAHLCLGKMFYVSDRYSDSCRELETASTQFRQLGKPSDILQAGKAASYSVRVSITSGKTPEQVFAIVQQAQADLEGDSAGSAYALSELGRFHYHFGEQKQALEMLESARATLEEHRCFEEVTYCLLRMSYCYTAMGDLQNCLRTCEQGLKISKKDGLDTRICEFSIVYARCHVRLKQYDEALKLCRESLPIIEALGHPLRNAQILELIGYILAMKKEYEGALLAYARARTRYSNMDETKVSIEGLARCDHNISQFDRAEGDEERVILEVSYHT